MGRVGAFRFCRGCRYDFDTLTVSPDRPNVTFAADPAVALGSIGRRLTRRRAIVGALAVLFGLAAVGSLRNDPATSPAVALGPANPAISASQVPATLAPARTVAPTDTFAPMPAVTPAPTFGPSGPTESARVVRVIDGDTIAVEIGGTEYKLRYIGMDTPETVDPDSPVEWMGPQATEANRRLVNGREVVLEKDTSETDRYGRLLRHVWLTDGATWTLVGLELVRLGVAEAVSYPPDVKYDDLFRAAESEARTAVVGLWGPPPTANPTARPTTGPTPGPAKQPSGCHPSYSPCLPIVGDLDCADIRAMGKDPVKVIGPDEYRLDGSDHDGWGCE